VAYFYAEKVNQGLIEAVPHQIKIDKCNMW